MRSTEIQHFLLVFDHDAGHLVEMERFGNDSEAALAAYAERERELQKSGASGQIEIVLIGSDSLETVKLTHANYFDGTAALSKYFVGILGPIEDAQAVN